MSAVKVILYGKPDCCLCDEAKEVLARARGIAPFDLEQVDISADPALMERFGSEIPVVFIAGRKAFKYRVDEAEFLRRLER